jgi:hypothetical protein
VQDLNRLQGLENHLLRGASRIFCLDESGDRSRRTWQVAHTILFTKADKAAEASFALVIDLQTGGGNPGRDLGFI